MKSRRNKKGGDEPGPVFVVISALSLLNSTSTSPNSAISRANAIRVNTAAKSATNDEIMPMTGMVANSPKKNAKNVAMVAAHRRKKKSTDDKKGILSILEKNSPTG